MNDTTDGITEAHILPTEDEVSTPVQQQPVQQQPSQQQPATQAESLMRSIQQNTNDLLLQNNHDVRLFYPPPVIISSLQPPQLLPISVI